MGEGARDDVRFEREALCWLPDVARFALSLTRNEADADDLVQDTFLLAYEKWSQFEPDTECRAWLFTICRHRFYRTRERGTTGRGRRARAGGARSGSDSRIGSIVRTGG